MITRTYSELAKRLTFEDRYEYLALKGSVAGRTFGGERLLNQRFYRSTEWKHIRNKVIARDNGLDMGVADYPIFDKVIIHHMNPIAPSDLKGTDEDYRKLLDLEFLISVSMKTHNAIHFSDLSLLPKVVLERKPGDTDLW